MSNSEIQRLVSMANQISRNCSLTSENEAVAMVANHLQKFWSRAMKQALKDYASTDGQALDDTARKAAAQLVIHKFESAIKG